MQQFSLQAVVVRPIRRRRASVLGAPDARTSLSGLRRVGGDLLTPMQIQGAIITSDAIHTQAESARFIVKDKKADYLFTVKDNQPTLRKQLESWQYRRCT